MVMVNMIREIDGYEVILNETPQLPGSSDTRITEIAGTSLSIPETPAPSLEGRVELPNPLENDATMEAIETYLTSWALGYATREDVKSRVIAFLMDPEATDLNLAFIEGLSLLPNIFNLDAFSRLKSFQADYSELTALPSTFFRLSALTHLHLQSCNFSRIPEEIGSLANSLEVFNLNDCPSLQEVPDSILSLSNQCHVTLVNSGLTPERIADIRRRRQELGDQSPAIFFTYEEEDEYLAESAAEVPPIEVSLQALYQFAGQEYIALNNLPNDIVGESSLRAWLFRLGSLLRMQNNQALTSHILGLLKYTDENPEFQSQFSAIITAAATTCGDRVILSVLHLGIAHQLITVDKTNLPALADFLKKGIWTIDLLGRCAEEKIQALRSLAADEDAQENIEEIEIYLIYPISLKERLNLPIVVESMLFSALSGVTKEELDQAYDFVSEIISSPEGFHDFLIHHEVWISALQGKYQAECESIINARNLALEDEEPEYEKIESNYNQALIELTRRGL